MNHQARTASAATITIATTITRPTAPAVRITRDTLMLMEDRVQLPRVYYTWPGVKTYSEDDAALDALADILANGKSSRLYRTLVYDKQIAQDVAAFQSSMELGSYYRIQATAREGHTLAELEQAIDAEIT